MDPIRRAAERSVGRGVAFSALGIACTMLGLAAYPPLALGTGAVLTLLVAAVLRLKALAAPTRPYRRTELWLLLGPGEQPPAILAQRLVGATLSRVLDRYAGRAAATAVAFWLASLLLRLAAGA